MAIKRKTHTNTDCLFVKLSYVLTYFSLNCPYLRDRIYLPCTTVSCYVISFPLVKYQSVIWYVHGEKIF